MPPPPSKNATWAWKDFDPLSKTAQVRSPSSSSSCPGPCLGAKGEEAESGGGTAGEERGFTVW
eukprot:174400-Rhodomonas_salina.1